MNVPERRLAFEGVQNFRDIGGYPLADGRRTRWGRVFRSDNLGGLTAADRERFSRLGIRTIVDFRVRFERDHAPSRLPEGATCRTIELDLLPEGGVELLRGIRDGTFDEREVERRVVAQYRQFVTSTGERFRRFIDCVLADDALPLLVHCTSGKDRTGFAVAALLMALGATRETIAADYLLTNDYRRDIGHLFGAATRANVGALLATAKRSYIEAAFDQIDRTYGSTETYLERGLGLDRATCAYLLTLLAEDS